MSLFERSARQAFEEWGLFGGPVQHPGRTRFSGHELHDLLGPGQPTSGVLHAPDQWSPDIHQSKVGLTGAAPATPADPVGKLLHGVSHRPS